MIVQTYVHQFIISLSFTILSETALLVIVTRFIFKLHDLKTWKLIFAGFIANALTVPYVWFIFPFLFDWSRSASLLYSEPFAFIAEAIFYRIFLKTSWKVSFTISLVANLSSYLIGPVLRTYGLWFFW